MRSPFAIALTFNALLAGTAPVQAASVVIRDKRCVSASTARVHDVVTGYDRYSSTPGAKYSMQVPLIGAMPMLSMVKSQSRFTLNDKTGTDANVWVVLQPSNLSQGALYPRFLLRCISHLRSDGFQHDCRQQRAVQYYGMEDFESRLEVKAAAPECSGKTLLSYDLRLVSNDRHVAEIKEAVLAPAGPLGTAIGDLFNEESFFRNYYVNFYNGWVNTL